MGAKPNTKNSPTTSVAAAITSGEVAYKGELPTNSHNILLDPVAAAGFLGGSKPLAVLSLADWRCKGMGPAFIKVGRLVRYRLDALEAFLSENQISTSGRG